MGARFSHVFMLTSDLAAERRLLVEVIGLAAVLDEGSYIRIGGAGGFHIGIEQGRPGPCDGMEVNIEVEDVEEVFERLDTAGVRTEGRPQPQEWGARHVWFRDIDGRRMSVFSND
jgi:catechol 2,3-dioxygenase-like lactoylglutathione lyase family enzyme